MNNDYNKILFKVKSWDEVLQLVRTEAVKHPELRHITLDHVKFFQKQFWTAVRESITETTKIYLTQFIYFYLAKGVEERNDVAGRYYKNLIEGNTEALEKQKLEITIHKGESIENAYGSTSKKLIRARKKLEELKEREKKKNKEEE